MPLGRLYGAELRDWLAQHRVELHLQRSGRRFVVEQGRVQQLELRQGDAIEADFFVSAVPFERLLDLLPAALTEAEPYFHNLRQLETSPITSVHIWFDRPVLTLPHAVLVDGVGQWVFNRGSAVDGQYLQVVVSAARQFRGWGREEVEQRIIGELRQLFPAARPAQVRRTRVITEHAATFSAVPGVDRWRPPQRSPLDNLFVAGDWTATGWPATMEGAVRGSGYLAAEALLERVGRPERLVQPDLQ